MTVRAVATGTAIGAVLCAANVYVVLKTGWSLGVTLSSTIIAFGLFRLLNFAGLTQRPLGMLENTTVSSVASAAAFMTGGGNMAAIPALLILTGQRPGGLALAVWFAVIAALGVVVAIPIKRQLLDIDRLPFPLGVATATTLRAMHDSTEGNRQSNRLFVAAGGAALLAVARDVRSLPWRLPGFVSLPWSIDGLPFRSWTLGFDASLVLLGGGSMMAPRTAGSMAVGGLLTYGFLAPALVQSGAVAAADYKAIVALTVWPGAALIVSSTLFTLLFQWRSALQGLAALAQGLSGSPPSPAAKNHTDEAPLWWFAAGLALLSPLAVWLMAALFDIPVWAGILAIPLAVVMGVVAGRVTGETDMSPTKALGPATQLFYGAILPSHLTANLMSASVTGGVGLHAGDLLTDLKAGQLVGASPRLQVLAQFFGVIAGSLVVVPAFALLVPDAAALGTPELPAPAVQVWASVSRALAGGAGALPETARLAGVVGAVVGVVLAALERWLPAKLRHWLPSPAGLGMAMVIPASTSLTMALGAAIALGIRRRHPHSAQALTPIASGLVAGESVLGMTIALGRSLGLPV
jgi:putative OPT family oligopeptide transporter